MLTKVLVFGAVALLTRSPILAAFVTLAVWVVVDWNAFQLLPRLGRRFWDLRRLLELRRGLAANPHDRRARVELGELYVRLHRPAAAIEIVREAVEVDPGDEEALYTLGLACLHVGERARGELFLGELEAARPEFRQGEIPFELALAARRAGDAPAAREALGRFLVRHPASVRGLAVLGEILAIQGDVAGATAARPGLARVRRAAAVCEAKGAGVGVAGQARATVRLPRDRRAGRRGHFGGAAPVVAGGCKRKSRR